MAADEITKSLGKVERSAAKMRKARAQAREVRSEADASILAARDAGATYRDIASAAGVSTAWVQASLERSGYQTQPR